MTWLEFKQLVESKGVTDSTPFQLMDKDIPTGAALVVVSAAGVRVFREV